MVHVTADPLMVRPPFPANPAFGRSMELAAYLMEIDPVTICLEGQFQLAEKVGDGRRPVLIPIEEVIRKLEFVTQAAKSLNVGLSVFACTEARAAVALNSDTDPRDRKFLSSSKALEGLHAYCGGLDAVICRALAFARYADVVCFKSSNADLAEANHFASEIKGAFPGKGLAFGHAPRPDDPGWNEVEHRALEINLRSLAYDHYFVTQFGRTVFPRTPVAGSWVLIDDVAPVKISAQEVLGGEVFAPRLSTRDNRLSSGRLLRKHLQQALERRQP